jgi:hypothetical protein
LNPLAECRSFVHGPHRLVVHHSMGEADGSVL